MRAREDEIQDFLAASGLSGAERAPIPGDASTRRYERLSTSDGRRLILMDAPPALEGMICLPDMDGPARVAAGYNAMARISGGRLSAFVAVAGYLRGLGLSAPEVLAFDEAKGLAVLEDLGDDLFARVIAAGGDERPLYRAAIEVLARIHQDTPPEVLESQGASWPLLTYDALALKTGADLFIEWLPKFDARIQVTAAQKDAWQALWAPLQTRAESGPKALAHRDYHAENLLWLGEREGAARVGLIDFQDALLAHPSWDLHSLLQDARRDVSPEIEAECLAYYFELRDNQCDQAAFLADYAALSSMNQARILGIFARLVVRDGKPKYRDFMPRMWGHLGRNLLHPDLLPIRDLIKTMVPGEIHQWA